MLILIEYFLESVFPVWFILISALVFLAYLLMQFSAWGFLVLCLNYMHSKELKEKAVDSRFHKFGKLLI